MGKSASAKARVVEYRMSIHFGVGHKLDGITEIRVDEKRAWSGDVSTNTALTINNPNLFGGQQKEGGLVGTVQVLLGADDQVLPQAAAQRYGRAPLDCPAFRGITTLMFHGNAVVSTGRPFEWMQTGQSSAEGGFMWKMNSPVIAQKVEVTGYRAPKGLNPALALSPEKDANFVSIIYECLTNTEWGMGGLPTLINTAGFEAEAARLAAEGMFGSVWWMRQSDIESFVVEMLTHIQATLFLNPNSGLLDIKLLRDDYDVENLRHITPSNAALSNFKRRSSGEIVNEMTVTWTNPITEQGESITAQDIASIENQGGEKVSGSGNYYAIRKQDLAIKVLQRDLRASTAPLISADAALDRSAWDLLPGEVVLMSWPKRQTYSTVMRIGKVNYGRPTDSKIRVSMLQDIFSLEKPPIAILPGTGWVDPRVEPEPLTMQLFTVPSYFTRNAELQTSQVALTESEALVGALADSETYDSFDYELISESITASGETVFTSKGAMSMTGLAYLSVALPAGTASVLPRTLYPIPDEAPKEGGFVILGYGDENQEFALVTGQSDEGWTLARGCLDTTPKNWSPGTPAWVMNPGSKIVDTQTIHGEGTTATYRALDRTALGVLPIDDAPPVSMTVTDRPNMPIRPANVKVNGVGFGPVPIGSADTVTVSWATRNRLLEDTQVLNWTDGPITPEYRQETVIRFYDFSGALIVEYDGFWDQESYDFPASYFDKYASVIVEVGARRDGVESLGGHRITITGLPGDIGAPPPGPGVDPSDPPSYIAAPTAGAYEITGGTTFSGLQQAILVSGTPDNRSATQLLIRYRVAPGPDDATWTETVPHFLNHNRQTHVVDLGLLAQTNYEVEVAYIVGTVPSRWRNIGQVVTGGFRVEDLAESVEQIGDAVDGLNQTVYDAQTGLQVRTGQLWDDINDAADGLKVRTAGLDEAINAAGTGLADRTDALFDRLDAPGTGIEARVTDLAQTVEDGDEASIERFQALEAFAAAGPNHCPNGGLAEGLEGIYSAHTLVWGVSGTWGPNVAIAPSGDGTYSIHWPEFGVEEGVAYTVSGDAVLFASGGVVYFDIIYLNSAGQPVLDGGESPRGPGDFSDSFERRKSMAGTSVCPRGSGAVTARARCVFESVVNPTAMGVRRVKVDFGDKPTAWSDETTEWQGASRLIDLDEVVQNPTSGLVRRTELLDNQLNTPTVGLSAQIASARQAITDLDEGKAEASDVQALNTQINTPGTGLAAQQLSAQEAISDLAEGKASASDLNALTSEIDTARGGQTSLNLRLNTVETDIDGKASATALQTLESEVNTPGTGIVARLTDAEGAVADLETGKAEASDLEALEVRSRSLPNLIPNSAAAQDLHLWNGAPIWQVGYGSNVGSYFFCDAAGEHYFTSKPFRLEPNTTYSFEFEGDGGTAPTENAVYFDLMDGTDATPGSGVQYGAGARSYEGVGWFTREGASFTTGPSVKWGIAVVKKAAASNYVTMTRLMLNEGPVAAAWTDTLVGRDLSARQLEMERVVLTPTTGLAERVFGLSSDLYTPTTGYVARLGDAERTLVDLDENKASASDVEALESSINTPNTGLLSRMTDAEETLVDLDEGKASASDVQDIQSALFTPTTGISARLTQVLQTAADLEQEKADVTALQQLEAITGVRENLAINGGLTDGLEGLSSNTGMVLDEDSWGRSVKLATFTGTGTRFITWPTIKVDPNTIYTISGDAVLFASGGVVYFDMIFLDAAGQVVGDGGEKSRGPGDFSNAPGRRQDMAFAQMSPSTAVRATPRCIFESVVNPTAMGARMLKIERGSLPATTWSDEASAGYTAAKLADLNRVVTTPTTGLASRLAVTESEITTPGTGLKARQQALTEALTDLDQGKASVLSVNELTAQLRSVPNQIANSGAKFDMDRWNGAPDWVVGHSGDIGEYFVSSASGERYLVSQPFRLSPNTTYTQSFEGDGGSDPGACSAYLDLLGGTEATPGGIVQYGAGETSFTGVGWFTRKSVTFTTGPNVFWGQYVVRKAATTSYVAATRFMLNVGDKAAAWTDSLSERELRASIQEVRSVAVSADGRSKAIVGNVLDVNGYVSGTASTNDGVQARFEVLADVFGIRDPGAGERTEYRAGNWYVYSPTENTRTRYGKAFGGSQKLVWWTGPTSISEGSETKANAYVYMSQNTIGGARFGGSDVGGAATVTGVGNIGVTLDSTSKKTVVTADIAMTANNMMEAVFAVGGVNDGPLGGNLSTFSGGWEITDRASPSGPEALVWSGTWTSYQDAEGFMSYDYTPTGFLPAHRATEGARRLTLKMWRVSGTTTWSGAGNLTIRKS